MIPIVPAFIPTSKEALIQSLQTLAGVPEIHLDLVDGVFVPFRAWPYEPLGTIADIQTITDRFTLEVDLMVDAPLIAASEWMAVGADMLVFHTENTTVAQFSDFARYAPSSITVSIAATCATSLEELEPYLALTDTLQLMGIAEIGAQGQPFDERVLGRIVEVKQHFPKLAITIDGSVNEKTIPTLKAAGANRFICGSAITKAASPLAAYKTLLALAN